MKTHPPAQPRFHQPHCRRSHLSLFDAAWTATIRPASGSLSRDRRSTSVVVKTWTWRRGRRVREANLKGERIPTGTHDRWDIVLVLAGHTEDSVQLGLELLDGLDTEAQA